MSLTRCFFSQHTATLAQFNAQRISQRIPPFEILCDITYVMNQNIRKWGRIVKMHLVDLHTIAFLRSTQNPKKSVKFRTLHRLFSMKNEDVEICCFAPFGCEDPPTTLTLYYRCSTTFNQSCKKEIYIFRLIKNLSLMFCYPAHAENLIVS